MSALRLSLLRGICQLPGYVADAKQLFAKHGLEVHISIEPTAWMVPDRMLRGQVQFAVIPWTRVVAASVKGEPLVLICGSGYEEAAIVVRRDLSIEEVRKVAVPLRGGIKDLTAMGLVKSLGWSNVEWVRQPSGDGAILSFVGEGADAASMVEPYATMLEGLGLGRVVKRTGDLWPGAPGCSLATTVDVIANQPEVVSRMVAAYVEATAFVDSSPDEAAEIGARFIGISPRHIRAALHKCRPNIHALRSSDAMRAIMALMCERGYIDALPRERFHEPHFLDGILERLNRPAGMAQAG